MTPLKSLPIQQACIEVEDGYYAWAENYFTCIGCTFGYADNSYFVGFPPGTVEETYPGRSTGYSAERTIRLPDGTTLTRFIMYNGVTTRTTIAIPERRRDVHLPVGTVVPPRT
jgi:hypothetical protein